MSIEYKVSQNGLRIDAFPKGVLDIQKTVDYFSRLTTDNRIKRGAIEIVYFKEVTDFKISYLDGEEITKSYQAPKEDQMINMTIFLCETDLAFGMGRMLQTFHEITNPNHKVMVVRSDRKSVV